MASPNIAQFQTLLSSAKSIIVVIPPNSSVDDSAAALSLYQAIKKQQTVYLYTTKLSKSGVQSSDIATRIPNRKLIISFPTEQRIQQVTTEQDQEHGHYNIMVHPQSDSQPLDHASLKYTYTLPRIDVVIGIGAALDPANLNQELSQILSSKPKVISINTTLLTHNADLNINNLESSSNAELVYQILDTNNYTITPEMATNLLDGIQQGSNNFADPNLTASTFETIAQLLRAGGTRTTTTTSASPDPTPSPPVVEPTPTSPPQTPPASTNTIRNNIPEWLNPTGYKKS